MEWLYSMSGQKSAEKMVNFRDKIGFVKMDKIGFWVGHFYGRLSCVLLEKKLKVNGIFGWG